MMADEFDEWDRFYATFEWTLTPMGAMQRYRHRRAKRDLLAKKAKRKEAAAKRLATIARKKALNSSMQASSKADDASKMTK